MTTGQIDLADLLRGMANREAAQRTEANVQSDLKTFLLAAPLELDDDDLVIVLEQQAGGRRRIDVEAGLCVFEVKRDLRKGNVLKEAELQLAGYVEARTKTMQQRYVGVLTDGATWYLYHLTDATLHQVSEFTVDPKKPDVDGLAVWLEGVLATAQITPTPEEINRRLGASSPGHAIDYAELRRLYLRNRDVPSVRLKRELWARLLTTALGTGFTDSDELFIEHTLLVATAEIMAHFIMGFDPTSQDVAPVAIVEGLLFANSQVYGVVEADFFDWTCEVEGGAQYIRVLVKRLSRFAWHYVEHDVLKVLYESIIPTVQRKQLGEYYTPDWLADRIINAAVADPLKQRVLDPSCGSGTFLFHAVRHYLAAAKAKGIPNGEALKGLTRCVMGMDIHPVAVTFARVTYLLAIGAERLQADDRPPLAIPVYLGDSIQWGQERSLFTSNALVIPTVSGEMWQTELRFPERTLADAGRFDQLVGELTQIATNRVKRSTPPSLKGVFRRYAIHPDDETTIEETFRTLCRLYDDNRNHIWGYYVRNLARPVWLSRPENRVDVLVGNPPWLSYRFMTAEMQREFRLLSKERGLWAGASVSTNQDLSALFILRAVERYLLSKGSFGFVMPWSALRGRQFAGFRSGRFELKQQTALTIAFEPSWDLHSIKPSFFPVPCSVVLGKRADTAVPLGADVEAWSGRLPRANIGWPIAEAHITRGKGTVRGAKAAGPGGSPYGPRFSQGAILVPRMIFLVEMKGTGPLGAGAGRRTVKSRRNPNEKAPWKSLPALEGNVERQFIRTVHLGETILPYRTLEPLTAVVPWDGQRLLDASDERISAFPGLAEWWRRAEGVWHANRSSDKLTLRGQLDYMQKLTQQFPIPEYRIVYTKSGMYLAAAIVKGDSIIDHKLYWGAASSLEEARYLEAVLNSDALTLLVRPLQARGEHNPRDFDKYVWQLPIPMYAPGNARHQRLAGLAEEAEKIAAALPVTPGARFEVIRRSIREAIVGTKTGKQIEKEVTALLK